MLTSGIAFEGIAFEDVPAVIRSGGKLAAN
jgi:hypothetical protein